MLTTRTLRRVEVWSGWAAASGQRTTVVEPLSLTARENLDGSPSLQLSVSMLHPSASALTKRAVIRVDQDDVTFDEWKIVSVLDDKASGIRTAMCAPLRTTDLAEAPPVSRIDSDGAVSHRFDSVGLTPAQHISNWVLPALAAAGLTWVSAGTITPTGLLDLTFDWTGPLEVLRTIAEKTGMELDIRRTGTAGYAIDLVPALNGSAATVDLRLGKNLSNSLRHTEDTTQQATRVYPKGGATDDEQATIAKATWLVTAVTGTVVTLADPNGGDGPIAFDGQFAGMYLRLKDGTLTIIASTSAATQQMTLGSGSGGAPPTQIFTANGTLTLASPTTAEVLIVAGGGGGGNGQDRVAGGGGGGGVLHFASMSLPAGSYPVVVGAGGAQRTNGGNSTFNGQTAIGGGRGGDFSGAGGTGGSGGGGNHGLAGGAGTAGQGFAGGGVGYNSGIGSGTFTGSGGGGASQAGTAGTSAVAGKGGDGVMYTTSGAAQYYGGGGGGSSGNYGGQNIQGGAGGQGGGGAGGTALGAIANGQNGTPNTGGGGGAGGFNGSTGGTGGSGIVIVNFSTGAVVAVPLVGDYVQVRADNTGTGTELTYLENPSDKATYGLKVGTLERSDIPSTNNRVKNSALRTWSAGLPVNWTKVGTPTVTQTSAAPFTRYGGSSAKVDTTADGQGIISDAVPIFPTAINRYISGFAELWPVSGNCRVELVFTTAGGPVAFPTLPNSATPTYLGQWSELGASGADAYAMTATAVQIRIVQHGSTASSFYVDGAQITESASQMPFVEGSGPTQLWQAANRALKTTLKPAVSYDLSIVDLAQMDPATFSNDCTILLGAAARITDPDMGIAGALTRIVEYTRDYLQPGNTVVVLSTKPTDLSGLLAATPDRAERQAPNTTGTTTVPPSLTVTATPSATTYSIAWSGGTGATVQLSINNGAWATAPASPILVSRPSAGSAPLNYAFRTTLNNQTVSDSVDIMAIDADTTTADLTVTPSTPTATTQTFSATATNPKSGGPAPTLQYILRGCTAAGGTIAPGTYAYTAGTNVVVDRPAFGTVAQASIEFVASISGGGSERIQRTILNQVKDTFGPSLTVTPTISNTQVSIAYVLGSGNTLLLSIDGGAATGAPASPIVVTRDEVNHTYAFQATKDGVTIPGSAVVPAKDIPHFISFVPRAADYTNKKVWVDYSTNVPDVAGSGHLVRIHYEDYLDGVFQGGGAILAVTNQQGTTLTPWSQSYATMDAAGTHTRQVKLYGDIFYQNENIIWQTTETITVTFTATG